jgi:endonuclease III
VTARRPQTPRPKGRGAVKPPIGRIIAALEHAHPDAKLALDFTTPLELLVALILAAQCTDAKVNEVTAGALFKRFRSARDYADVPQEELEALIRSTGFYRQKAAAVRACCRELVERFGGEVPHEFDSLLSLPGVGRKTANILLGNAYAIPGIGVDTHVGRLSQRLGLTRESDPDKIEADLVKLVPRAKQIHFCHLLQYHGRRICEARRPRCPECVLLRLCPFPDKTPAIAAPKSPKASSWVGGRRGTARPARR